MAKLDFSRLEKELSNRAEIRKKVTSAGDRETTALEGIYDELTSLNALVAAMLNKMK